MTLNDLNLRPVASRAWPVPGAVLLGPVHQDQPDLAHLQPRSESDGEAAQLHESAITARNLLLPRHRSSSRWSVAPCKQQKHLLTLERCSEFLRNVTAVFYGHSRFALERCSVFLHNTVQSSTLKTLSSGTSSYES